MKTLIRSLTPFAVMLGLAIFTNGEELSQEWGEPIPPAAVPATATFFSMTLFQPPLPMHPFPELAVYQISPGVFVYDDRSVDYVQMRQWSSGSGMAAYSSESAEGEMMSMSTPPSPGGGSGGGGAGSSGSNTPPYSLTGLKLTIPLVTNGYLYTTIFEHDPARAYDLYYKTNLNLTNWTVALGGFAGETNYWLLNSFIDVFLRAASGLDSDGDGMSDGWEAIHGLNPHSAADANLDADGDGLSNLLEFSQGSNPNNAPAFQVIVTSPRSTVP